MNETPKFKSRATAEAAQAARQRVLAEWRGIDVRPLELAQSNAAQALAQVMPRVLQDMQLDHRRADVEILKAWNALLDPNLTAHAQPVNLHKGTLFVAVDNNVWLSEVVRYRRKEILDRLQHCFGKDLIVKLSFRVG